MKLLLIPLGVVALILVLLFLLALVTFDATPLRFALELGFGWASFLGRVVPKIRVNPAAVGFFLVVTALMLGTTHWLARSLSNPQGARWRWRWTLGLHASIGLLFLTAMGVTGVAHQVGWLWRSDEPWSLDRNRHWRSSMEMLSIVRTIEAAVHDPARDQNREVSEIRAEIIGEVSLAMDHCYFQLFPGDRGPFRAAVVRPRSQEALERHGFFLVRKVGRVVDHTKLGAQELGTALEELAAGREYLPASGPANSTRTDRARGSN
jgi:hypothetical protein